MKKVVLLGTAHTIQRGQRAATEFRSVLVDECNKYNVKAIAEEAHNSSKTVASKLASDLQLKHLYADPDSRERHELGIATDCRLDIVEKYQDRYSELAFFPKEPSAENLPAEVWEEYDKRTNEEYRRREQVWLKKIINFDQWPLLFICGANHFQEFSNLLKEHECHVIESHEDWAIE